MSDAVLTRREIAMPFAMRSRSLWPKLCGPTQNWRGKRPLKSVTRQVVPRHRWRGA